MRTTLAETLDFAHANALAKSYAQSLQEPIDVQRYESGWVVTTVRTDWEQEVEETPLEEQLGYDNPYDYSRITPENGDR
jgi:hypothetical protein